MSNDARAVADQLLAMSEDTMAELCTELGIELLVMFGSAAAEGGDPGDVDLAALAPNGLDPLALLQRLHDLTKFEGYDILDLRRASPVARERALVGTRLLYQSQPGLFATTQIAAIMERMDTEEMRRLELELMSS